MVGSGGHLSFWLFLALWGGDLDLSVTCTFCSTVASFATTTFWIWLFGRFVLRSEENLNIPYLQLFISLVSLVIPIFVGLLITYKRPAWSKKLVKISRPALIVFLVVVWSFFIYINRFFFTVVSWEELVAPACLGGSGYFIGIIVSLILGLNKAQVIALSVETAIQNAGIANMVIQSNIPSPYGDMALLPVFGYIFTASGLLQFGLYLMFKIYVSAKSFLGKNSQKEEMALDQKDDKLYM